MKALDRTTLEVVAKWLRDRAAWAREVPGRAQVVATLDEAAFHIDGVLEGGERCQCSLHRAAPEPR